MINQLETNVWGAEYKLVVKRWVGKSRKATEKYLTFYHGGAKKIVIVGTKQESFQVQI